METLFRGWFFGRREGAFTAGMAPYPPLGGAKAGIGIRVSGCESVVFCGGGGQPAGLAAAPKPLSIQKVLDCKWYKSSACPPHEKPLRNAKGFLF